MEITQPNKFTKKHLINSIYFNTLNQRKHIATINLTKIYFDKLNQRNHIATTNLTYLHISRVTEQVQLKNWSDVLFGQNEEYKKCNVSYLLFEIHITCFIYISLVLFNNL